MMELDVIIGTPDASLIEKLWILGPTTRSSTRQQIGTPGNVAKIIAQVKSGKQRLIGIGHRVYKYKDPRVGPVKAILETLGTKAMWIHSSKSRRK